MAGISGGRPYQKGDLMPNITTRQYRILSDHMDIYRFMVELYERDWRNGVPAPFLEYALSCTWMDKSRTYQNRIWLDGDPPVWQ